MAYRLLAVDLDGTTIGRDGSVDPRVLEALTRVQAAGVRVVVATGRAYPAAHVYAERLSVTSPLVCIQGAYIGAQGDGPQTMLAQALPLEPLPELFELVHARGLEFQLYSAQKAYLMQTPHPDEYYERWFGLPIGRVENFTHALETMLAGGAVPLKGLFVGSTDQNDRLQVELVERFDGRLGVVRSDRHFVEVLAPGASKGNAISFLAQRWGIDQAEVVAVGDSGNDVSMLEWAGLGVAMGNASPEALAAADWIAPDIEHAGVAAVIEQYILPSLRKGVEVQGALPCARRGAQNGAEGRALPQDGHVTKDAARS